MFTEDWKSRYNDGQSNDGQNRERRPYNSNRSNYGNNQGNSYGRSDNRGGSYNRQQSSGNYDRRDDGGYNRQRNNYNRDSGYERPNSVNYDRSGNYRSNGNYDRPYNFQENGVVKKRRPRVGESVSPIRKNFNDRPNGSGYSNPNKGGSQLHLQRNNKNRVNNKRNDNFNPNVKNIQKQLKYREEHFDPNELIRLNKYLANAGVCSRREADEFIQAGLVKVNGVVITELGSKVKRCDQVVFHDQPIKLEHKIYILLNKPKNCVTTADDPQERLTVMDLVKNACQERISPVGRLDRNTTGVLLLTNDGDLSSKLTHPKFLKKKIYHVWLDKNVSIADMQKLAEGIDLEDGEIHADAISYISEDAKDQVGIEIHSGRNRIVRRMFESLGYHVVKLDRVYFAGLTKKNLKRGQWRFLTEKEVSMLRMGAFE
jgi:23S rRNA pseudouridine2605 synthase